MWPFSSSKSHGLTEELPRHPPPCFPSWGVGGVSAEPLSFFLRKGNGVGGMGAEGPWLDTGHSAQVRTPGQAGDTSHTSPMTLLGTMLIVGVGFPHCQGQLGSRQNREQAPLHPPQEGGQQPLIPAHSTPCEHAQSCPSCTHPPQPTALLIPQTCRPKGFRGQKAGHLAKDISLLSEQAAGIWVSNLGKDQFFLPSFLQACLQEGRWKAGCLCWSCWPEARPSSMEWSGLVTPLRNAYRSRCDRQQV